MKNNKKLIVILIFLTLIFSTLLISLTSANLIDLNKVMENDMVHGLSIYFPENKDLYNRCFFSNNIPLSYKDIRLSEDTHWDYFLVKY